MLCSRVGRETLLMNTEHKTRRDMIVIWTKDPLRLMPERRDTREKCLISIGACCRFFRLGNFFQGIFHKTFVTKLQLNETMSAELSTEEAFETLRISLTALVQSFWALLQVQRIVNWSLWLLTSSSEFREKFARLQKFSEFIDTFKVDNSMQSNCCNFSTFTSKLGNCRHSLQLL